MCEGYDIGRRDYAKWCVREMGWSKCPRVYQKHDAGLGVCARERTRRAEWVKSERVHESSQEAWFGLGRVHGSVKG